ncbi:MAG: cation-translocating P-type ATPase [Promethearchaeota archaeon]
MSKYHAKDIESIAQELNTDLVNGLSSIEVKNRLEQYGPNVLQEAKKVSPIVKFFMQFKDFLVVLLIAAGLISMIFGDYIEAVVIFIIIILNAILGFIQEFRAEQSLEKLKDLAGDDTLVIRDGKETRIDVCDLVPGDILLMYEGETIAADARIFEANRLKVEEGILTGESVPVDKSTKSIEGEFIPLAEQSNMAFMGTITVKGRGKAMVVRTGMETEMGKIAKDTLEAEDQKTPLQENLERFGKILGMFVIGIMIVIIVVELFIYSGTALTIDKITEILETSIALAVSAVPEGLAAAITLTLAIGVQRMAKKKAIMRSLPAVETLGSVEVICTDKTGTLTQNKMTVLRVWTPQTGLVKVSGAGYNPKGKFINDDDEPLPIEIEEKLHETLKAGYLASTAKIQFSAEKQEWQCEGDPTEGSLIVSAMKTGLKPVWEEQHELKPNGEIFFDSERKRMTMVYKTTEDGNEITVAYSKGSPESILDTCSKIMVGDEVLPLSKDWKDKVLDINTQLANKAFRVLGMAKRMIDNDVSDFTIDNVEKEMIFLGLEAMIDPPRTEVEKAVEKCKNAGIRIIMITGDQRDTAMAIARALDLKPYEDEVYTTYTAAELEAMSEDEFRTIVKDLDVCARASPSIKKRIVKCLQDDYNQVVAMTGDGVNDAPALKKADIGIAMGITGTDVAREAADMILTDDNFSTIVSAVEEGRNIYKNMKSFIRYMLSSNFDEIMVVFTATVLLGLESPYLALGILWINLITDGLPSLSLAVDVPDPNIMKAKPRGRKGSMMSEILIFSIIAGIISYLATMSLFLMYYDDLSKARTLALTVSVIFELFQVFVSRTPDGISVFRYNPLKNKFLLGSVISAFLLQLVIIYTPAAAAIFHFAPLSLSEWLIMFGIVIAGITLLDITRLIQHKISKRKS